VFSRYNGKHGRTITWSRACLEYSTDDLTLANCHHFWHMIQRHDWCCPLHHPSSTAFVSKNRNHCTTCWILPKAGPKVWFPKVLSWWRSWVGLGVYLLKKSASMSAVFLKGVVTLPNSTCCLQKCFLMSMCLVAGLLDGCRPIVIAPDV